MTAPTEVVYRLDLPAPLTAAALFLAAVAHAHPGATLEELCQEDDGLRQLVCRVPLSSGDAA